MRSTNSSLVMGVTVPEPSAYLSIDGILLHKPEVLSLSKIIIKQRMVTQFLTNLQRLLSHLIRNFSALVVLTDCTRPGFEDLKDRVISILFFLLVHRAVLAAGIVRVLWSHAVAILGLASIGSQKISSAVLTLTGSVAMVHTV